mgnify:CR=1 FL=1
MICSIFSRLTLLTEKKYVEFMAIQHKENLTQKIQLYNTCPKYGFDQKH